MPAYLLTAATLAQQGEVITLPATLDTDSGFSPTFVNVPSDGDILMKQTNDGGDITVDGGIFDTTTGLETAAYLSLFCGDDTYWADLDETDPVKFYTSSFTSLLAGLPVTGPNLLRLEDAARSDLAWLGDNVVDVSARAVGVNRVVVAIEFVDGQKIELANNWGEQ